MGNRNGGTPPQMGIQGKTKVNLGQLPPWLQEALKDAKVIAEKVGWTIGREDHQRFNQKVSEHLAAATYIWLGGGADAEALIENFLNIVAILRTQYDSAPKI